jgi:hypothetical protein
VARGVKSYETRSYIPEKKQKGSATGKANRGEQQVVYENAAGAGRAWQEPVATAR